MNLNQTLIDFENNQRQFEFTFTTVWSDPNTYLYEGNSTWSGSAQIIGVIDDPSPQPLMQLQDTQASEPATVYLVVPALLGMFAYQVRRQRRRKSASADGF
jgi:hypothetical protein